MLVYHVRIQKPPQSIGYHKRVLKKLQTEKILQNEQVSVFRKSLNY